jgi:hypothetical protein
MHTERFRINSRPRNFRFAYTGTVRLTVPFPPWRLRLTLDGRNLSSSGVQVLLKKPVRRQSPTNYESSPSRRQEATRQDSYNEAVESLIAEGDPFELQLEHSIEHLPAPVLPARLIRRESMREGTLLAFAFETPNTDLLSLVHELEQLEQDQHV